VSFFFNNDNHQPLHSLDESGAVCDSDAGNGWFGRLI
jgi:hypothetical protein